MKYLLWNVAFHGKSETKTCKSFRKMQHMNIKDGLLKIRVQRLQGPVFKSTNHSVSFDKSKCRCCAKLPHRCSATLLVARTEHPHQGSCMPIQRVFPSPGRACLTSYRNMGRHTCSVSQKFPPFCVAVEVGVVRYREAVISETRGNNLWDWHHSPEAARLTVAPARIRFHKNNPSSQAG